MAPLYRCLDVSESGKDVLLRKEEIPFWFKLLKTVVLDQEEIKHAQLIESGHREVESHQDFISVQKYLRESLELLHDRSPALVGSNHVSALDCFNEPAVDVPHFDHVVRKVRPIDQPGGIIRDPGLILRAQLYIIVIIILYVLWLILAISLLPANMIGHLNYVAFLAKRVPIGALPSITAKIRIKLLILHLNLVCHLRLFKYQMKMINI